MLVRIGCKYFEDVKRLKLNAAAAVAQGVHDHLRNSASDRIRGRENDKASINEYCALSKDPRLQ